MITSEEIDAKASELEINQSNVQRDYIFGWLIAGIFGESRYSRSLLLKGGNAFRKAYFPATRFSEDLDFTTTSGINSTDLLQALNDVCRFVQARTGVVFEIDRNYLADEQIIDRHKKAYKFRLYFRDFYGQQDDLTLKVRLDVTEYDRIYLPPQTRRLIHPYSDAAQCSIDIQVIKLEEALADKLKCLLQRRHSFDLFDLVYAIFIAREIEVDRPEIVRTFLKKTIFEPSPLAAKNLLLGVPFDLMQSFWDTKIVCPRESRLDFSAAIGRFKEGIEALFAPFSQSRGRELAFYPPELRNQILEAGQARTLLHLTYDGVTRLVEPYSLVFKRRISDGAGQEYLYGWDTTGGRGSGPGIKTFFHWKIQHLENTDQEFEPRFTVELSKAGEFGRRTHFGGTSVIRSSRTRPARARSSSRRQYRVQCSYCQRIFTRTTNSVTLRPHNDQFGNRCYGRRGYRIG